MALYKEKQIMIGHVIVWCVFVVVSTNVRLI